MNTLAMLRLSVNQEGALVYLVKDSPNSTANRNTAYASEPQKRLEVHRVPLLEWGRGESPWGQLCCTAILTKGAMLAPHSSKASAAPFFSGSLGLDFVCSTDSFYVAPRLREGGK